MGSAIDAFCDCIKSINWIASVQIWVPIIKDILTAGAAIAAIYGFKAWRQEIEFKQMNYVANKLMKSTLNLQEAFIEFLNFDMIFIGLSHSFGEYDNLQYKMDNLRTMVEVIDIDYNKLNEAINEFKDIYTEGYITYGQGVKEIRESILAIHFEINKTIVLLKSISSENHKDIKIFKDALSDNELIKVFDKNSRESYLYTIQENVNKMHNILQNSLIQNKPQKGFLFIKK